MANVAGKAYAITNTTPMVFWKTPILRFFFFVIRVFGIPKMDQEHLKKLSFIHFARWVAIPRHRWPRLSERQPPESVHYDYLLFCSNFNGTFEQYIDAFSEVIPGGMNNIWRWSTRYPGSRPITPFLAYIYQNQYDNDYYYNATPGATTTDILHALELKGKLDAFIASSLDLAPEPFERAFATFLRSVQSCLATTGPDAIGMAADVDDEPVLSGSGG